MQSLTPTEAAMAGGIIGSIVIFISVFSIIFCILTIIANWKIFEKANEPGWKALIPIYNLYIMFKIVNMKSWFWWLLGLSVVGYIIAAVNSSTSFYYMSGVEVQYTNITAVPTIVVISMFVEAVIAIWAGIVYAYRTSKVFGHGLGYTFGLIFLPNIFQLILGFGSSKYDIKRLKK